MRQKTALFIVCFTLWMILSGETSTFFIVAGVVSSFLTVLIAERISPGWSVRINRHVFGYIGWLMKEVAVSSWEVTKTVWSRKPGISPQLLEIRSSQKNTAGYTVFGNSLTLTPGTVAVKANHDKGTILIHALTESGARDAKSGQMDKRVAKICG